MRTHTKEIPDTFLTSLCSLPVGMNELLSYVEEERPETLAYGDLPLGTGEYVGYHLTHMDEAYSLGISRFQVYSRERKAFGRVVTEHYEPYGDVYTQNEGDVPVLPLPEGATPSIARVDIPDALIRNTYRTGMVIDPRNHIRILGRRLGCVERDRNYAYYMSKGIHERSLALVIELVRPLDPIPAPQKEVYRLSFITGILGDWNRVLGAYYDYLLSGRTEEARMRYVEELMDILSAIYEEVWGVPPQEEEEECVVVCTTPSEQEGRYTTSKTDDESRRRTDGR